MKSLKVSAETDPGGLAGAIASTLRNGEEVELLSVGAGALNQAVKAVVLAKGFLSKEGRDIAMEPDFLLVEIEGKERTAIDMHVFEILPEEELKAG